jgi:hypothetical protein
LIEDEPLNLAEMLVCVGIGWAIRSSGPERVFVELNALASGAAKDHSSEPTIPDWKGFLPY